MNRHRLKLWVSLHKWSSLICTAFLLMLCITGLPLIFHDEIEGAFVGHATYEDLPDGSPRVSLDEITRLARLKHPGSSIRSISIWRDPPGVYVVLGSSRNPAMNQPDATRSITFDARTGKVVEEEAPSSDAEPAIEGIMHIIRDLHVDMFADLSGQLLLAAMGSIFLFAIISGVVLYSPFTRKLGFGTVRADRSSRLAWLDLHNLLGITTLAWVIVVSATGVIHNLSDPLQGIWRQNNGVAELSARWKGDRPILERDLYPIQSVFDEVERALPGTRVTTVSFPGNSISNEHYVLGVKGDTKLTAFLDTPVIVDARTGEISAIIEMPWYLRILQLSRPLHYGDYGGLPMKILWALLDIVTIIVLVSGLYLWFARRRVRERPASDALLPELAAESAE